MPEKPSTLPGRIASLDQFRGYTVAGMLFVNFLGGMQALPGVFKHHNTYCSYADTIMPQFFFAVGYAYRLTFLKRLGRDGAGPAVKAVLGRVVALLLLGFVLHHLDGEARTWADLKAFAERGILAGAFRREYFQTLVHIALTSLWILPVIGLGTLPRVLYLVGSGVLHFGLSWAFYYNWAWNTPVIDGGQLGFMTWSIPTLLGSLAYDAVAAHGPRGRTVARLAGWSAVLMVGGYLLSCLGGEWAALPFVPPTSAPTMHTMSQRAGSVSYLTFSAGFSLAVYAFFLWLSDMAGVTFTVFRVFGTNALAAYIIHPIVSTAVKPFLPNDAPGWYVACGFLVYFGICYVFNRYLERHGLFLKL